MRDPEFDLHIAEVKVRLRPQDAELLRLLAERRDMPVAVLARTIIRRALSQADLGAAAPRTEVPARV